jgi:hypothetical protein
VFEVGPSDRFCVTWCAWNGAFVACLSVLDARPSALSVSGCEEGKVSKCGVRCLAARAGETRRASAKRLLSVVEDMFRQQQRGALQRLGFGDSEELDGWVRAGET